MDSRGDMPTIEDNLSVWDQTYDWPQGGEEWSKAWGSALPRISALVPADAILEIALATDGGQRSSRTCASD